MAVQLYGTSPVATRVSVVENFCSQASLTKQVVKERPVRVSDVSSKDRKAESKQKNE